MNHKIIVIGRTLNKLLDFHFFLFFVWLFDWEFVYTVRRDGKKEKIRVAIHIIRGLTHITCGWIVNPKEFIHQISQIETLV